MKLESQVVSLELARQLKEAWYKQEGLFWWIKKTYDNKTREYFVLEFDPVDINKKTDFVAPTIAELGEVLPIGIISRRCIAPNYYCENFYLEQKEFPKKGFGADTEANARAKMWLYLKEIR